jgi:hypothetical protein
MTRVLSWAVRLAVVAIVATNIVLTLQNRSLKKGGQVQQAPTVRNPAVGQTISKIAGVDLEGRFTEVRSAETTGIVVLAFSPSCPYSRANYERWTEMSRMLLGSRREVVWVTSAPLALVRKYVMQFPIHDRVLVEVPHHTYMQLGLDIVPATAGISREGKVERVWYGGLQPADWSGLREYAAQRAAFGNPVSQGDVK